MGMSAGGGSLTLAAAKAGPTGAALGAVIDGLIAAPAAIPSAKIAPARSKGLARRGFVRAVNGKVRRTTATLARLQKLMP